MTETNVELILRVSKLEAFNQDLDKKLYGAKLLASALGLGLFLGGAWITIISDNLGELDKRAESTERKTALLESKLDNWEAQVDEATTTLATEKNNQLASFIKQSRIELSVIQEEIESREGRLRYLKDNIALSTINIEMYQELKQGEVAVVYEKGFFSKAKDGFLNGWSFILELLVGLINLWPILLIISLIVLFRKTIKRMFGKE